MLLLEKNRLFILRDWKELTAEDREKMTNRSIQGDFSIPIPLANLLDESSNTKVKIFKIKKKNRNKKKREKEKKKQKLKKKSLKVIVLKKNMKY